ncbi:SagB/ThcOx family dehydrogenase [Staphylococcus epidermidis]|nr:SagB/ThcOx family dehydrogenase [Staphylococcus epidermidis]MCG2405766.1 SagB/ThcOx family dehydrogenase [Staphylococcus epidermidis]
MDKIIDLHNQLEDLDLDLIIASKQKKAPSTEKYFDEKYKRIKLNPLYEFQETENLIDVLNKRKSGRDYDSKQKLDFQEFSSIIYYSYGIKKYRSNAYNREYYPVSYSQSAGGLNPFNIYIYIKSVNNIPEGLYYYSPQENSLILIYEGAVALELNENYTTEFPIYASFNIFICTDISRFIWKYGFRGYRMVNIDCGVLAQNISLLSTFFSLESCIIAAFSNTKVIKNLDIPKNELPLIGISIGASL